MIFGHYWAGFSGTHVELYFHYFYSSSSSLPEVAALPSGHKNGNGTVINGIAGQPGTRTLRTALMETIPSLTSIVNGPCTALLPLNDWIAANDYHWFRSVGVSIPAELSILSFDNERMWEFFPFSSIDFGLADLAYLTAHVFVDDIPIATDRLGNVAAQPRVVDRGSLGWARGNPLQ